MKPLSAVPKRTIAVGTHTEARVLTALLEVGYVVLMPFGVTRYDLAFDPDDGTEIKTVQCKTGRLERGAIWFSASSTRTYGPATRKDYRGQVDYLGVWCPDVDDVYLVPPEQVGRRSGCLRLEPTRNHQKHNIRWAKDFRLSSALG